MSSQAPPQHKVYILRPGTRVHREGSPPDSHSCLLVEPNQVVIHNWHKLDVRRFYCTLDSLSKIFHSPVKSAALQSMRTSSSQERFQKFSYACMQKQRWEETFTWSNDISAWSFLSILGIHATGRCSADTLWYTFYWINYLLTLFTSMMSCRGFFPQSSGSSGQLVNSLHSSKLSTQRKQFVQTSPSGPCILIVEKTIKCYYIWKKNILLNKVSQSIAKRKLILMSSTGPFLHLYFYYTYMPTSMVIIVCMYMCKILLWKTWIQTMNLISVPGMCIVCKQPSISD